jgi:hypothetical protein
VHESASILDLKLFMALDIDTPQSYNVQFKKSDKLNVPGLVPIDIRFGSLNPRKNIAAIKDWRRRTSMNRASSKVVLDRHDRDRLKIVADYLRNLKLMLAKQEVKWEDVAPPIDPNEGLALAEQKASENRKRKRQEAEKRKCIEEEQRKRMEEEERKRMEEEERMRMEEEEVDVVVVMTPLPPPLPTEYTTSLSETQEASDATSTVTESDKENQIPSSTPTQQASNSTEEQEEEEEEEYSATFNRLGTHAPQVALSALSKAMRDKANSGCQRFRGENATCVKQQGDQIANASVQVSFKSVAKAADTVRFPNRLEGQPGRMFFAVDINQVAQIGTLGGNIADVQKPKTAITVVGCASVVSLVGALNELCAALKHNPPRGHTLDLVKCCDGETFQSNYAAYVENQKERTKPSTTPRTGEEVALDIAREFLQNQN